MALAVCGFYLLKERERARQTQRERERERERGRGREGAGRVRVVTPEEGLAPLRPLRNKKKRCESV